MNDEKKGGLNIPGEMRLTSEEVARYREHAALSADNSAKEFGEISNTTTLKSAGDMPEGATVIDSLMESAHRQHLADPTGDCVGRVAPVVRLESIPGNEHAKARFMAKLQPEIKRPEFPDEWDDLNGMFVLPLLFRDAGMRVRVYNIPGLSEESRLALFSLNGMLNEGGAEYQVTKQRVLHALHDAAKNMSRLHNTIDTSPIMQAIGEAMTYLTTCVVADLHETDIDSVMDAFGGRAARLAKEVEFDAPFTNLPMSVEQRIALVQGAQMAVDSMQAIAEYVAYAIYTNSATSGLTCLVETTISRRALSEFLDRFDISYKIDGADHFIVTRSLRDGQEP